MSPRPTSEVDRCTCDCGCTAKAEKGSDFCRDCAGGKCPIERLRPVRGQVQDRAMRSPR